MHDTTASNPLITTNLDIGAHNHLHLGSETYSSRGRPSGLELRVVYHSHFIQNPRAFWSSILVLLFDQ